MPLVRVAQHIDAPADEVWPIVNDIEAFPGFMGDVRSVEITAGNDDERTSRWSVCLEGSVLEWTEIDRIDHARRRISFHQIDGDLEHLAGSYQVTAIDEMTTETALEVDFEIGIPLLAEMLNPAVAEALRENSARMLDRIDERVARSSATTPRAHGRA